MGSTPVPVRFSGNGDLLAIEQRAVADLVPSSENAKLHDSEQIEAVARSMQEFGFTQPVLIGTGNDIIAGHCRVLAAKLLGLVNVPVIVLGHLTPTQKRLYLIADNKLTERGAWDFDLLQKELIALKGIGADLNLSGILQTELEALFNPPPIDDQPAAPPQPQPDEEAQNADRTETEKTESGPVI